MNTPSRKAKVFLAGSIVLMALAGMLSSQLCLLAAMAAFIGFFISNVAALQLDDQL